jgi:hypothetical protein
MSELKKFLPIWFLDSDDAQKLVNAIDTNIDLADLNIDRLYKNIFLSLAEAEALDDWGTDFSIPRSSGESDTPYRYRILASLGRAVTRKYILEAIDNLLTIGKADMLEPQDGFFFDRGCCLDRDRLWDDAKYQIRLLIPRQYPSTGPPVFLNRDVFADRGTFIYEQSPEADWIYFDIFKVVDYIKAAGIYVDMEIIEP